MVLNADLQRTHATGGCYFAKNGNLPIFIADNEKIVYISGNVGHKRVTETEISMQRVGKGKVLGTSLYNHVNDLLITSIVILIAF